MMPEIRFNDALEFTSFGSALNVAVVGATGAIGGAIADELAICPAVANVFRLSRSTPENDDRDWLQLDLEDEGSIARAASAIEKAIGFLDLVIVSTGILHDTDGLRPEKTWRTLSASALEKSFQLNAIGPALVAKHFLPLLATNRKSVFAALSARVGSIEDNELGGWYSYRASKAAINMLIKTLSIELARRNPDALCVGLHPGTVDSRLSKPFQGAVPEGKLFSAKRSARHLLSVLDQLTVADTGYLFAWDGSKIPF